MSNLGGPYDAISKAHCAYSLPSVRQVTSIRGPRGYAAAVSSIKRSGVMGRPSVSLLYKRMSAEDRSTFNRWLTANAIPGSILAAGIVAMAVAGSRSVVQPDAATAR